MGSILGLKLILANFETLDGGHLHCNKSNFTFRPEYALVGLAVRADWLGVCPEYPAGEAVEGEGEEEGDGQEGKEELGDGLEGGGKQTRWHQLCFRNC